MWWAVLGRFFGTEASGRYVFVPQHSLVLSVRIPYGAEKESEGVQ